MSASTYTIADIHAHLLSQFHQAQLQVIDESAAHAGHTGNPHGDAISHIKIQLRSHSFAQMRTLAQHRAVHNALAPFYAQGLHAVVLDTAAL